jgi:antitoxin HicB
MDDFYPIVVVRLPENEGGGYMGYAPDLPGCLSDGDTPEEAMASTKQAAIEWLEEAKELNRAIPAAGSYAVRMQIERERLFQTIKEQSQTMDSMSRDIEKFESELQGLRAAFKAVTECLDDPPGLSGFNPGYHLARHKDGDAVH